MVIASATNQVLPFIVFAAFMLLFAVRARRSGQSVNEYLSTRNRETFTNLRPGWWKVHVAFAAIAWAALWITSGFKLVALLFLPVILLWVPFWGFAFRAYYRRHD